MFFLHQTFRALNHTNFRYYFWGQGISLIGSFIQDLAMLWLVYRLTNSPQYLGLVTFLNNAPVFIFAPLAGVIADRLSKKKLLIATQMASILVAATLAIIARQTHPILWTILSMSLFSGIIFSMEMPIRQSFLMEIIDDKENIGNAIALNSTLVHVARLMGPAVAGLLVAAWGESLCFGINALSYIAVIVALLKITPQESLVPKKLPFLTDFKSGLAYARQDKAIFFILSSVALLCLTAFIHPVVLPALAKENLTAGPKTLGFLMSAMGLGSLIGALYLASLPKNTPLLKRIFISSLLIGPALAMVGISHDFLLTWIMLLLSGIGLTFTLSSSNTLLQTYTVGHMRGKVMSLYTMCFKGMVPISGLLAGFLASHYPAGYVFIFFGILCLGVALFFARGVFPQTQHIKR
jgi:MFS family permease